MGRIYTVAFLIIIFISCRNEKKNNVTLNENAIKSDTLSSVPISSQEDVVFYNLFSPVDVANLVDNRTAYYNSSVINALNHITQYNTSSQMALNVGIYGADLSYLWIFHQSQQALSYLSAIQHLTDKLEIPRHFIDLTMELVESSAQNTDTLIAIARKTYAETNRFLTESHREHTSTLILLGGWIESMYITLNMYQGPDIKLTSKILSQKFSLLSLMNLIENNPEDPSLAPYLQQLKILEACFSGLESKFSPESIMIDTVNKKILVQENGLQNASPANFSELKDQIQKIRNNMVK